MTSVPTFLTFFLLYCAKTNSTARLTKWYNFCECAPLWIGSRQKLEIKRCNFGLASFKNLFKRSFPFPLKICQSTGWQKQKTVTRVLLERLGNTKRVKSQGNVQWCRKFRAAVRLLPCPGRVSWRGTQTKAQDNAATGPYWPKSVRPKKKLIQKVQTIKGN